MEDGINGYKLTQYLLSLSESKEWNIAKNEWELDYIYYMEEGENYETCSCGHYPIKDVCIIKNLHNKNTAIVGNVCVKKFINQIDSGNLFDGLKRISQDLSLGPSNELIEYAFYKGYIDDWEYKFCIERFGKSKFSPKSLNRRKIINQTILNEIKKVKN